MQILASITFPRFDLEEDRTALQEAITEFGSRPNLERFKHMLQIMGNTPQSVPFGDPVLMRVSMNEQFDYSGGSQFSSGPDGIIELCNHCDNEVGSTEYDRIHNYSIHSN